MPKIVQNLTQLFSLTDEKAMIRVRDANDHAAFALLVERWQGPIRRLCIRMMGDDQRGEDLTQETFARLFQKRAQYEPKAKFSTYLWRVAMNLCYDELRKRTRQWEQSFEPLETLKQRDASLMPSDESPHQVTAKEEEAAMVREALAKLPETYRSVLILRHYEGLKLREIADVLEIPPGTVNSRMAEALNRLSKTLMPKLAGKPTSQSLPSETPSSFRVSFEPLFACLCHERA